MTLGSVADGPRRAQRADASGSHGGERWCSPVFLNIKLWSSPDAARLQQNAARLVDKEFTPAGARPQYLRVFVRSVRAERSCPGCGRLLS